MNRTTQQRLGLGMTIVFCPTALYASPMSYTGQPFVMQSQAMVYDMLSDVQEPISAEIGESITSYARQFLGNPYVYGGNDLNTGVDCSGLVQQVLKTFGVIVPRTAQAQSEVGAWVEEEFIQVGDLVFFGTSISSITHVGIYLGNGEIIHASTPETGIIISPLHIFKKTPIQVIRRVIL